MKQGYKKPTGAVWEMQQRFCEEFLLGVPAYKAAEKAGYSPGASRQTSSRLLSFGYIQEYLAERKAEMAKKFDITREDLIREMAKIAMFDVRRMYNEDGTMIPIQHLDDISAAAISGVEIVEEHEIKGTKTIKRGYTKKVKFSDKLNAVLGIFRSLGYNPPDKHEHSGPDGGAIPITEHRVILTDYSEDGK